MTTPITNNQTSTGRSPDADKIYNQYLTYYNDINTKINTIDKLPQTTATLNARNQLITLQGNLYPIYTNAYNNSGATLATFISAAAVVETKVNAIYTSVTGQATSTPPSTSTPSTPPPTTTPSPIAVYTSGQRSPEAAQIYQQYLTYYGDINTLIGKIDALPYAQRTLSSVQLKRATLQDLQKQLYPIYTAQYNSSTATLASFISACAAIETQVTQTYNAAINTTATVTPPPVTPTPTPTPVTPPPVTPVTPVTTAPPPTAMTIQNGTWYLDWTSYNYPIPQGVNAVDIFVGNMSLDSSGKPTVGGFGTLSQNPATLTTFIQGCKAKGITVNISIGGGGGSYDDTWDVLTSSNVQGFAQALANFCTTNGISGVDFDCEEFTSASDRPSQQALVGTLIKDFKLINPNFHTSLCTNAGFGPNFPWQGIVQNIMNASIYTNPTTGKATSGVDRVNIMAYFNSLSDEQGWVTGWANWLKATYNFSPAQITVGMFPGANAYNSTEFAAWAAKQGYSTFLWNYDPNLQSASNAAATSILNAYNAAKAA